MQPQGHLQTLVRMIDHRQQPQAACDAPRWKVNRNQTVICETTVSPETVASLKAWGHSINAVEDPTRNEFGAGQFIRRLAPEDGAGYISASDFRRDGQAAGF